MELKRAIYQLNPSQLKQLTKELNEKTSATFQTEEEHLEYMDKMTSSILEEGDEDRRDFLLEDLDRLVSEASKSLKTKFMKSDVPSVFRRDFKIFGTITESGGLSYVSLKRQIAAGLTKGHTEEEIVEGVIRAISAGARLRNYLEGKDELTLSELKQVLQSHFKEQTPTELYKKLCNLTQGTNETATEFLMRALDLKQKVISASGEEDEVPYDDSLVERMFIHALATGIRDDNIRHRLRPVLKPGVEDVAILKHLNEITLNEQEHSLKIKTKGTVSNIKTDETIKTLQEEIVNLKAQVNQLQMKKSQPTDTKKKKLRLCKKCEESKNEKCNHCFKCGSLEHYARGCRRDLNGQGSLGRGTQ